MEYPVLILKKPASGFIRMPCKPNFSDFHAIILLSGTEYLPSHINGGLIATDDAADTKSRPIHT